MRFCQYALAQRNSQGHIGTDPQYCYLLESTPHADDNLWLDAYLVTTKKASKDF